MFKRTKNEKGFTLIELMIVVAIIGILAAVAIPNFLRYQAKSTQSEARVLLSGLYTAQTAYFAENNAYGAWDMVAGAVTLPNVIGFEPASTPRTYADIATVLGAGNTTFTATTAAVNLDGDATVDTWQVTDAARQPTNLCSDVTNLTNLGAAC